MAQDSLYAIVTGSASGLGAATAEILARSGARLVINYSSSQKEAEATAEVCRKAGAAEVLVVQGDVSKDEDCRKIVAAAGGWGKLDILVNNAGITKHGDGVQGDPERARDRRPAQGDPADDAAAPGRPRLQDFLRQAGHLLGQGGEGQQYQGVSARMILPELPSHVRDGAFFPALGTVAILQLPPGQQRQLRAVGTDNNSGQCHGWIFDAIEDASSSN